MELYILDSRTLEILSVNNVSEYNLNLDEETNGISEFVLPYLRSARKGNFIVLNGLYKQFLYVIDDDVFAVKGENTIRIPAIDISNIFNRKVILKNKENMQLKSVEEFIADNIRENFINSDDSIFNINYIEIVIKTATKAMVTINDEEGIYNFHTFLVNCRQYKDIYTEFAFVNKKLIVTIEHKVDGQVKIDATLSEVTDYSKIYEVDPVTKVECLVKENNSVYYLYLTADRTTTEDKNNTNRIFGRVEAISAETLEDAKEKSLDTIRANTYTHLVEFKIAKTSKLIDVTKLYIGRKVQIKTEDDIYDSYVSAITLNDENFVAFKTGNLRIDFTDKKRQKELKEGR